MSPVTAREVEHLGIIWSSIDELCSSLGRADWNAETDLPGWSVKDVVAHLAGSESFFLGRPLPEHDPGERDHVKNDLGSVNEVAVDFRRSHSPREILDEFRAVTEERLIEISALTEADLQVDTWTPVGPGTMRDLLATRVVDAWTHEQDIRRAAERPGHLDGPVPVAVAERLMQAMPYVIGKRAAASDGSTVSFEVGDPPVVIQSVGVEGSRARPLVTAPSDPDVWFGVDIETFGCLTCGRWTPEQARVRGQLELRGDEVLGERVLNEINVML